MNISHVKISNILGIAELEFDAGQFNLIEARNGSGKTSVLEAIKAAFRGGHDATLLRKGADKGEIVLVLDDGQEIVRRVSATKSDTVVRRGGKQVARPAEIINYLTDLLSVNPVDFLRAPKKDRVRVLLESMPLVVDPERMQTIAGGFMFQMPKPDVHALQVIDVVHKAIYDERTHTNRSVKEKEGTIVQLRAALPEQPGGMAGDETQLTAALQEAADGLEAERQRITAKLESLRADHNARLDVLRQQIEDEKAAFADTEAKAGLQRQRAVDKHGAIVGPINEALAGIRANRDAAAKREQSLRIIDQFDGEAQELRDKADAMTASLEALEQYKIELLSSLPIAGLEIRDGELYRDGVPFDRLNTAQQVQIAVDVAKLRAGPLGVVCVDGIELLDTDSYKHLQEGALASGLQFFVTGVTDGDMEISVEGGGAQ